MENYTEVSDPTLVDCAVAGDLKAFDELVRRYQQSIANLLFRFCPHQADLEDLVQETMIKAYRKLEKKNPAAPFEAWLRRIAINTGHDYYRRSRREPTMIADRQQPSENHDPLDKIESNLTDPDNDSHPYTEEIQKVLADLEPDDRLLITLQYLHEMPLAEIASHMDWTVTKTKVKSFRARKKLQRALKAYGISEPPQL